MSILTAISIAVGTAYDETSGFLDTKRQRTLISIQAAGLESLATDCGCTSEEINSVFLVFEHSVSGANEVVRFNKFDEEAGLLGHIDGALGDEVDTYEEKLRIVTINRGTAYKFYKETNLTDPEKLVFIQEDVTGDIIWDCGAFTDVSSEPALDGEDFDPDPGLQPPLDGGDF